MVGGEVIGVIQLEDKVWVNCKETQFTSQCAIYVEKNDKSRCIGEGDMLWWQCGIAYWTPACNRHKSGERPELKEGKGYDIELKKLGYSGVNKPQSLAENSISRKAVRK